MLSDIEKELEDYIKKKHKIQEVKEEDEIYQHLHRHFINIFKA